MEIFFPKGRMKGRLKPILSASWDASPADYTTEGLFHILKVNLPFYF